MALPIYYLNQGWSQTYGEQTNAIVARAFAILDCVIYEFKNKETKNRQMTNEEFVAYSNQLIMKGLFDRMLQFWYDSEGAAEEEERNQNLSSSVMNSLSFNLSPYVKMLPRFDAIPVIISCIRQDDIRIVKMGVETLLLLCQWNGSFVKTITDYMFSSAVFMLLNRLRYNILNNVSINHFTKKSSSRVLGILRKSLSTSVDESQEEEMKRNVYKLDTTDAFLSSISNCSNEFDNSLQALFFCSEDNGQIQVLHQVLLLILYMEGKRKGVSSAPTELITELHASDCEGILMGGAATRA